MHFEFGIADLLASNRFERGEVGLSRVENLIERRARFSDVSSEPSRQRIVGSQKAEQHRAERDIKPTLEAFVDNHGARQQSRQLRRRP
jgi:hypothetical protein